ncbi:MAG TPA: ATP-binding protein [Desulfobacteraceae bacterium]|nr:ATP-binding protein [Desulfobacteraceae bacterium]HPJ67335.1 ATP-binding protein [Desulfobacteraceae bacterium]HPQ28184.1 ATP-binding protein [Desulfobacteraceae bacterium]
MKKEYEIKAKDFVRAGKASIGVQSILKNIGFQQDIIRRICICAYESEMNVVMHGADGTLSLNVGDKEIVLEVKDCGKGIEDIEMALKEGYSTASEEHRDMGFGAGMGLPNIKKNSDNFEITSQKGNGTHLKMVFRVNGNRE